jgi:hypothetical protein
MPEPNNENPDVLITDHVTASALYAIVPCVKLPDGVRLRPVIAQYVPFHAIELIPADPIWASEFDHD